MPSMTRRRRGGCLSPADLPELPAEVDTLFLGGISLVNDPAASTYEALQARECGTRVTMVDPNIRPGFIAGKEADYRARIERMVARADIVKLSDEDLHWLEGQGDLTALARGIIWQGAEGRLHHRRRERGAGGDGDAGYFFCSAKGYGRRYRGRGRYVQRGVLAALHQARGVDQGRGGRAFRCDAVCRPQPWHPRGGGHGQPRRGQPALGGRAVRAVLQRVAEAQVRVEGELIGETGKGFLILVCAMGGDTETQAEKLAAKVAKLRVFKDDQGKMNLSVRDIGGTALVVSQFTLAADLRGNRPGFSTAAPPEMGERLYRHFSQCA
jgi:D-tyrosyl-tRNA(Tyr) deacylase